MFIILRIVYFCTISSKPTLDDSLANTPSALTEKIINSTLLNLSLPSIPFDEHAWIFDLPAKEETVLQSRFLRVFRILTMHYTKYFSVRETNGNNK